MKMKDLSRSRFSVLFRNLSGLLCLLCLSLDTLATSVADTVIQIRWGVYPLLNSPSNPEANGTRLMWIAEDGSEAEADVTAFNERYVARLLAVGDGRFDMENGYAAARWMGSSEASTKAAGTYTTGFFWIAGDSRFPLTYWGTYVEPDPDDESYDWDNYLSNNEWYNKVWSTNTLVTAIQEKSTGRLFFLSETPGGSPVSITNATFNIRTDEGDLPPPPGGNTFTYWANTPSMKVYLGTEIPYRTVWIADHSYTAEDLAGYSDEAIRFAMAADLGVEKLAAEERPFTLRVSEFTLTNDRGSVKAVVKVTFDAHLSDGSVQSILQLKGGSYLQLEAAEFPGGPWRAVAELSGADTVALDSSASDAAFYRVHLVY